ncbi:MAG: transcriptional repressor, partial [Bacilli bacterium]
MNNESGLQLKKTKGREKILAVLKNSSFPMTCDDIYKKVSHFGVNLSTVYRSLNSFEECGIVKKEIGEDKKNVFTLIRDNDHHILVCIKCHKKVEIPGCPYHEANEKISKATGYQIID